MDDSLPSWTDVAQVVIGTAGMLFALWTLVKLVSRDKQRESEIASLSNIAHQLRDLQVLNEKRYIESKKPHLEITCSESGEFHNLYFLYFKNVNNLCQITSYDCNDLIDELVQKVNDFGKEQKFSFSISTPGVGDIKIYNMVYTIENKFKFQQKISVYWHLDELRIQLSLISLISESLEN